MIYCSQIQEDLDKRRELHRMPKFLIIYRRATDWPLSGHMETTACQPFDNLESASDWLDDIWQMLSEDCTDAQLYEYTGIQYVLIERRHRDD